MRKWWLGIIFAFFLQVVPGFSRGDKVIPQVADGSGIRTKLDLTNVSPRAAISNFTLSFYRQDGTPWTVRTTLGTGSSFTLNIAARQVLRVETLGTSSPAVSGWAMIEDNEPNNSAYAMDYVLGISVYYEISNSSGIVDTVSVPVGEPTALGTFPVEYTQAKGVYTGIAIVNLKGGDNNVQIDLYSNGTRSNTTTIRLAAFQQRAEFFHENMFKALANQDFKGLAEFKADGPVAILALLQANSYQGIQYATLVPVDREGLRRNSYMYVPEATYINSSNTTMPVDVDNFTVDFFRIGTPDDNEGFPWDFVYNATGKTTRRLEPVNGALFAPLGILEDSAIDAVSLPDLMSLKYSTNAIDMSDNSANLKIKYSFAVLTDLGHYAKIRLINYLIFTGTDGNPFVDLMFEVTVYR